MIIEEGSSAYMESVESEEAAAAAELLVVVLLSSSPASSFGLGVGLGRDSGASPLYELLFVLTSKRIEFRSVPG